MLRRRVSLRSALLGCVCTNGIFGTGRAALGAALAVAGIAFTPEQALAAVGTCAPDASGTLGALGPIESCSGDFATGISYPGAVGTAGNFEVDLNAVTNVI